MGLAANRCRNGNAHGLKRHDFGTLKTPVSARLMHDTRHR
jgi:hypothetical protein